MIWINPDRENRGRNSALAGLQSQRVAGDPVDRASLRCCAVHGPDPAVRRRRRVSSTSSRKLVRDVRRAQRPSLHRHSGPQLPCGLRDVDGGVERPGRGPHHSGTCHRRTSSANVSSTCPHSEHVFDEGKNRSTVWSVRPYQSHLYSSIRRNMPHAASEIARARHLLRTIPLTLRSSTASAWFSATSRVLNLCRKSRRLSAIRAWIVATRLFALKWLREPFFFRASDCCASRECRQLLLEEGGRLNFCAIGKHGEVLEANVDADGSMARVLDVGVDLDDEADLVAPKRIAHHRATCGVAWQLARPAEIERLVHLGQIDLAVFDGEGAPGELGRLGGRTCA